MSHRTFFLAQTVLQKESSRDVEIDAKEEEEELVASPDSHGRQSVSGGGGGGRGGGGGGRGGGAVFLLLLPQTKTLDHKRGRKTVCFLPSANHKLKRC